MMNRCLEICKGPHCTLVGFLYFALLFALVAFNGNECIAANSTESLLYSRSPRMLSSAANGEEVRLLNGNSLEAESGDATEGINLDRVDIYHLIDNALWGEIDGSYLQGNFPCSITNDGDAGSRPLDCNIYSSDSTRDFIATLNKKFNDNKEYYKSNKKPHPIAMSLYNIHSWKAESNWPHQPSFCRLPSHLSLAESEESFGRFGHLFKGSFPYFDGYSTTHPDSSVPRSYVTTFTSDAFLEPVAFGKLIAGGTFVASTCHHRSRREEIVKSLRKNIRVDGLGKCLHTPLSDIPEGVSLAQGRNALESLQLKRKAISNYQFYLAFENTKESGYITEKVFDGLMAGSVPVYYGASDDCKKLFPLKDAIIYVDDYKSVDDLSRYLLYLSTNKTAYETHRAWRKDFSLLTLPDMLRTPWPCRLCRYARSWMKGKFDRVKYDELLGKC